MAELATVLVALVKLAADEAPGKENPPVAAVAAMLVVAAIPRPNPPVEG